MLRSRCWSRAGRNMNGGGTGAARSQCADGQGEGAISETGIKHLFDTGNGVLPGLVDLGLCCLRWVKRREGMDHRRPQCGVGGQPGFSLLVGDLAEQASGIHWPMLALCRADAHGDVDQVEAVDDPHHGAGGEVLGSSVQGERAVSLLILRRRSVSFSGLVCINGSKNGQKVARPWSRSDDVDARRRRTRHVNRYTLSRTLPTSAGRRARLVPPGRRTGNTRPSSRRQSSRPASCCNPTGRVEEWRKRAWRAVETGAKSASISW